MNYKQTIDFLFAQLPMYQRQGKAAYKANLNNTLALDKHFDYPHRQYLTVHIAGTNGKGSVSHMLASVLQQAGYKTGLYTSPHLKDFRERIKVNGAMIDEQSVVEFVEQNKEVIESIKPSFFEMTVAMAFQYFAKQNVDIAIIETGMGGRLDSTNIVSPMLSVITNIGLDHTAFLGDNLQSIAGEKAGIIKPKTPVVIGEWHKDTASVFMKKALENNSPIVFANRVRNASVKDNKYTINFNDEPEYIDLELDLLGSYQQKNILTVLTALDVLKKELSILPEHIKEGVRTASATTGLKGRWQQLSDNPKIICDIGHNVEGVKYIVEQIDKQKFANLHIVWGMVNDKDIDKVLKLLPKQARYYFTKASIPRAMSELELMRTAKTNGLNGSCYANVSLAIRKAKENAQPNDFIFIGGSTFVVAEIENL